MINILSPYSLLRGNHRRGTPFKPAPMPLLVCGLLAVIAPGSSPLQAQDSAPGTIVDTATNAPPETDSKPPTAPAAPGLPADSAQNAFALFQQAALLYGQGKSDAALALMNNVLQVDPSNINASILRGAIYTDKKLWSQAEADFKNALRLDPKNKSLTYDLADLKFKEGKFDEARQAFLPMQDDYDTLDVSDLVKYKMFLCDLFGNHDDMAAKELYVFNQTAANPSYYFGNCAWALVHKKPDEARTWLASVNHLYSGRKQKYYSSSLEEMGYLPIPSPLTGK